MRDIRMARSIPEFTSGGLLQRLALTAALLAIPACSALHAAGAAKGEFPDSYYYYEEERPATLRAMEGKQAPSLALKDLIGDFQSLAKLKGKVVVVDFWATWCPPCRDALPKNVKMVKDYGKQGFVIVGVHDAKRGADKMAAMAKDKKLNYPLAVDDGGKSTKAWNVQFWPSYFVIDRKGTIRAAGLDPDFVDKVVKKVLADTD